MNKKHYLIVISFLYLVLVLCFVIYFKGLKGYFLFDDYPNLQDLGTYGSIDTWDKIRNFVSNGFAGPTGRPISLASFLIDANTWPADPYSFKYNNLMIHLLNGILLYWATLLLLKNYNYKEQKAIWIALLSMAFWLLHPYMVSTTLYIVQRMAQLATLFSLAGIIGYLKASQVLATRPWTAYLGMAFAIGAGTILATYSKENGALLPLLILIIEFCNPNLQHKPTWQWRAICLWLPSCAVLYLIFREINFANDIWPNRNFNQVERLFSEARIVTEYLFNLWIPQIELRGLYQDGYNVSRSITQPITTLYSIIFLVVLSFFAFACRKKYPLLALAILFFFAAHLMESTVIGLELYFEHRNYLAALFLFLPLASGLIALENKIDRKLVILIITLMLGLLSFFTYERTKLWGKTNELQLYWVKISPNSPRAQNSIADLLFSQGDVYSANQYLEKAIRKLPHSALLNLKLLLQKVYADIATPQDFVETGKRLEKQPFDAQAIQAVRTLVEYITENKKVDKYGKLTLELIESLENDPTYNQNLFFQRLIPYLKAKIYLAENQVDLALEQYSIAVLKYNDVEAGLMMVAEIGSANADQYALILLDQVEKIYRQQNMNTLKRSAKEYEFEIKRIRGILQDKVTTK